jgi:hypothetical protein
VYQNETEDLASGRGLSVRQLAHRWAIAPSKVRALIRSGRLEAIDLGLAIGGRRCVRVLPEALATFERSLMNTKTPPRRRRQYEIDAEVAAELEE